MFRESEVPSYELPDPLLTRAGRRVVDAGAWHAERAPEIRALFSSEVYGEMPGAAPGSALEDAHVEPRVLGGRALRKQLTIRLGSGRSAPRLHLLLHLPGEREGPAPVFLGLNFFGNHTTHPDPGIRLPDGWLPERPEIGLRGHRAEASQRGLLARRWPIERIVARGYGVATAYCGDLDPDFDDGFRNGVHPLFEELLGRPRDEHACGAIGAWAWGLRRALDHLLADPDVDGRRVAVFGHSRLGKAALFAGAFDERFALVISNDSGCGGAALARRRFGETVALVTKAFPHWFCARYAGYAEREAELPVDQHLLLALVAPRPLYVASASEDLWADPRGELLAALGADPVYRLLGTSGIAVRELPAPGGASAGAIGHHLRAGPHELTAWDWDRFLEFADLRLGR